MESGLVTFSPEAGLFDTVKAFHDWYTFLCRRPMADPYSVPIEPFRYGLPDDCAIKFTHGDLNTSNIMFTRSKPYRVVGLIDWEQSGWSPEYWEARKAEWVYSKCEGWTAEHVPMILCMPALRIRGPGTWRPWDVRIEAASRLFKSRKTSSLKIL